MLHSTYKVYVYAFVRHNRHLFVPRLPRPTEIKPRNSMYDAPSLQENILTAQNLQVMCSTLNLLLKNASIARVQPGRFRSRKNVVISKRKDHPTSDAGLATAEWPIFRALNASGPYGSQAQWGTWQAHTSRTMAYSYASGNSIGMRTPIREKIR